MSVNEPLDPFGLTRRGFLRSAGFSLGAIAYSDLLRRESSRSLPVRPARAKRVIYLFQAGGPAQQDLLDWKPELVKRNGEDLPESIRRGQRLTGMSGNQATLPLAGSIFPFAQHGASGAWFSDLLPHTAAIADELTIIRSLHTEAINHDPAITFFLTGSQIAGRPSMGAWIDYGLGSANENLPAFIVMVTKGPKDQPLYERLWGAGFLPSRHQGVQFRSGKDPVLFLENPAGVAAPTRRKMLDALRDLAGDDPEARARLASRELAFRMQTSVPEVADLSGESEETYKLYGDDAKKPGTFAANCLLARRLAERGVRFIQIFHQGWDQHDNLPDGLRAQCRDTDRASAALVTDLKRRGMLDDTLVVWGGEFGRTSYSQGKLTPTNYGRDHHPRAFTMWMAGAGMKKGLVYGATDDFGYNIAENPVHVHDLQALVLDRLGLDHEHLTFAHQGRRFRLTDVSGRVISDLLA